jgi:crotonobetainyl-CoA:carnitine CoA-transferase CaiB-like acyl-CoA transferase
MSIASERTFRSLAAASGHPQWLSDLRFAEYGNRRANWGELIEELERWSTERTTGEVQAIFDRYGVPSSPYRTVKEAMADPQIAHRQAFGEVHDAGGTFQVLNPPFRMSATTAAARPHVAALGEHTVALLAEIGYTPAEIAALNGGG